MKTAWILLAGPVHPTAALVREAATAAFIVAADAGVAHAESLGLVVNAWVGDFDSSSTGLRARHVALPSWTYPEDKDQTDGELAVERALAWGAKQLVLVGALGGDADHHAAHLMLALALAGRGVLVRLTSGLEEVYPLLPGRRVLALQAGERVSIVPVQDLKGLDISGVVWPLVRADVPRGSTLTLRNRALGRVAINLEGGEGFVFVGHTLATAGNA